MPDDTPGSVRTSAQNYRLGRQPPRQDPRTLRLTRYLTTALEPPPPTLKLSDKVGSWPMFANDRLGDCTCATAAHMVELWTALSGQQVTPAEPDVVAMYNAITGGVDAGAVELDVLNYWRKNPLAGEAPLAFAAVDPKQRELVQTAAALAGGVYIGVELPLSAQRQVGSAWDVPPGGPTGDGAPGSWGGHAVNVVDYDAAGLVVVTWGALQPVTWAFWDAYVEETWCVIPSTWSTSPPAGVDVAKLEQDLAALGRPG